MDVVKTKKSQWPKLKICPFNWINQGLNTNDWTLNLLVIFFHKMFWLLDTNKFCNFFCTHFDFQTNMRSKQAAILVFSHQSMDFVRSSLIEINTFVLRFFQMICWSTGSTGQRFIFTEVTFYKIHILACSLLPIQKKGHYTTILIKMVHCAPLRVSQWQNKKKWSWNSSQLRHLGT